MKRILAITTVVIGMFIPSAYAGGDHGYLALGDGSKIWITGSASRPGERSWYRIQNADGSLKRCRRYRGNEDALRKAMLRKHGGTWRRINWPNSIQC